MPTFLARVREELAASFVRDRPIQLNRAPSALDVVGGTAACTGSLVCAATIDRGAWFALQEREDREVQVFSFNQFDDHAPFTLRISLDAIAALSADDLRRAFDQPGRHWAACLVGCLFVLHHQHLVDLRDPQRKGLNLAVQTDLPKGAGGTQAAVEAVTMSTLLRHFELSQQIDSVGRLELCRAVGKQIVGETPEVIDLHAAGAGERDGLLRVLCQSYQPLAPLLPPPGARVVGILGGAGRGMEAEQMRRICCAAFIGHRVLLEKMRQIGRAAKRTLAADPMGGYLANLGPEDYQRFFRPHLPEAIKGGEFLLRYGGTVDAEVKVEPAQTYPVRRVTDHHIFEAARARRFVGLIEEATAEDVSGRERLVREAGKLMYESHASCAGISERAAPECDVLIQLIRECESRGLFGARMTAGGTAVALLAATGEDADAAIAGIVTSYHARTGVPAEVIASCAGARISLKS